MAPNQIRLANGQRLPDIADPIQLHFWVEASDNAHRITNAAVPVQLEGWFLPAGQADSPEAIKAMTFDIPALLKKMRAKLAAQ